MTIQWTTEKHRGRPLSVENLKIAPQVSGCRCKTWHTHSTRFRRSERSSLPPGHSYTPPFRGSPGLLSRLLPPPSRQRPGKTKSRRTVQRRLGGSFMIFSVWPGNNTSPCLSQEFQHGSRFGSVKSTQKAAYRNDGHGRASGKYPSFIPRPSSRLLFFLVIHFTQVSSTSLH
jgi:hypothetical protein